MLKAPAGWGSQSYLTVHTRNSRKVQDGWMDGCKQGTDKMYRIVCREMDETCGNRNRHIF